MWRRGQGKIKVKSRQFKQNLNRKYNLMGFDNIEINLVILSFSSLVSYHLQGERGITTFHSFFQNLPNMNIYLNLFNITQHFYHYPPKRIQTPPLPAIVFQLKISAGLVFKCNKPLYLIFHLYILYRPFVCFLKHIQCFTTYLFILNSPVWTSVVNTWISSVQFHSTCVMCISYTQSVRCHELY